MRNGIFSAIAFFAATVSAGYFAGNVSWNGKVFLTDSFLSEDTRNPAAIRRELDFSRLDGKELITATQNRLVKAARVIMHDELLGVELGHFVTRSDDGQRKLACDSQYNRITLKFEAEGIAEAGEKTLMVIDGPCKTGEKDITSIEPVWIPVAKILQQKPADMDFSHDEGATKVHFENMGTQWPLRWSLQSVRLYNNAAATKEVAISARDLREIRKSPLVVNWTEFKHSNGDL